MTFIKNLLSLLSIIAFLLIGSYLQKIDFAVIVIGLAYLIPGGVMVLIAEDFWRKVLCKETRKLQTWQYFFGMLLMLFSVQSWLWFINAKDEKELFTRLGITFFLAVLGLFWDEIFYKRSVIPKETMVSARENKRWRKARAMGIKAGAEGALRIWGDFLKYRLVGNHLDGAIRLEQPIAAYKDVPMTLSELLAVEPQNQEDAQLVEHLRSKMTAYLQNLAGEIPVNEVKE